MKKPIVPSIVQPIIDHMKKLYKHVPPPAPVSLDPLRPAEQDQDAGSGFNSDHTDPQT